LELAAKAFDFVGKQARSIGRDDEGLRHEARIAAEGAVEPNGELTGHPQLMHGLALVPRALVDGSIATPTAAVKALECRSDDHAAVLKTLEKFELRLLVLREKAYARGDVLREHFAEEAELVERGVGIGGHVGLGRRGEPDEDGAVALEEVEVGRRGEV